MARAELSELTGFEKRLVSIDRGILGMEKMKPALTVRAGPH